MAGERLPRGPSNERAAAGRSGRRLAPVSGPLAVGPLVLLVLAAAMTEEAGTAEAAQGSGDEKCHYYAGGEVYPGEASRLPGKDHSLHLSKAKISKPAPDWEGTAVINGEFKELKLSDYEGKYLVFFFYPLDFTFVCPTEINAFSDRIEEFRSIDAEVVACSVDSQFTHLAWINTQRKQGGLGPVKIPLLSDLTHQISKDYGVYLEDQGHALRGLFIIDDKKILRQITLNDLPVGRSVDETLRLVQAFQYTDKHGEVCPAGWKPGSETIKPEDAMRMWWSREEL
ncbi:peroxiredoxin-4 isoform X2 [Elgaria multicarinata webbii]|uniref:peroxiredoxin-4 isoform X2 n=1 Tax=Elgaria multicarinata webbii TaxID=159646 RepID=UPI002FCCDFCE